jgi:hypothetical protein
MHVGGDEAKLFDIVVVGIGELLEHPSNKARHKTI